MSTVQSYLSPNSFHLEGDDHINISPESRTRIGMLLDPSYCKVLNYPHIGKFASVSSLWYWLQFTPTDDALRKAKGKSVQRMLAGTTRVKAHVPNFKAIIGLATYMKLKDYSDILDELRGFPSDMKVLSYFFFNKQTIRMTSGYASVMVPVTEYIIKALKEGKEPSFDWAMDVPHQSSFSYLEGFMRARYTDEVLQSLGLRV